MDWKVTGLLCDAAQAIGGKLYVLGGGWTITGPGQFQHALAFKIAMPPGEAGRPHDFEAVLLSDGVPAKTLTPGIDHVRVTSRIEVRSTQGVPPGMPIDVPIVVNVPAIRLEPSKTYEWVVRIDGRELWRTSFRTRDAGQQPPPEEQIGGYL